MISFRNLKQILPKYEKVRSNPLPIFAFSGTGTGELLDLICSRIKKVEVL
ncbi:hypothetical protein KY285_033527 [Solanum tuberosum]|nr:hypothetical protein KY285_033527 [Solanum tuberosum]